MYFRNLSSIDPNPLFFIKMKCLFVPFSTTCTHNNGFLGVANNIVKLRVPLT